jgi:prepilin-type N-terminal cleavage/methylation domain-containing protein
MRGFKDYDSDPAQKAKNGSHREHEVTEHDKQEYHRKRSNLFASSLCTLCPLWLTPLWYLAIEEVTDCRDIRQKEAMRRGGRKIVNGKSSIVDAGGFTLVELLVVVGVLAC